MDPPRADTYGVRLAPVTREWHSGKDRCLTQDELREYLRTHDLLAPWRLS
jgi:hypothetical protein